MSGSEISESFFFVKQKGQNNDQRISLNSLSMKYVFDSLLFIWPLKDYFQFRNFKKIYGYLFSKCPAEATSYLISDIHYIHRLMYSIDSFDVCQFILQYIIRINSGIDGFVEIEGLSLALENHHNALTSFLVSELFRLEDCFVIQNILYILQEQIKPPYKVNMFEFLRIIEYINGFTRPKKLEIILAIKSLLELNEVDDYIEPWIKLYHKDIFSNVLEGNTERKLRVGSDGKEHYSVGMLFLSELDLLVLCASHFPSLIPRLLPSSLIPLLGVDSLANLVSNCSARAVYLLCYTGGEAKGISKLLTNDL